MVKVFCMLPVMAFAFCLNLQQGWSQNEVSSISFSYFVMYGVVLVLGGYWLALIFMFVWRLFANTGAADTKKTFLHKLWNRIWESVFSAISGGVGGIILYLVSTKVLYNQQIEMLGISKNEFLVCFGVPAFLIVFLLGATLLTGLTIWYMSDDDREWATRFGAILLKVTVAWSIASFATIYGPKLFGGDMLNSIWVKIGAVIVPISGALSALGGFSGKTPSGDNQPAESKSGLLISIASSVVAPIAVLFLLMFISNVTHCLQYYVLAGSELEKALAAFTGFEPLYISTHYNDSIKNRVLSTT